MTPLNSISATRAAAGQPAVACAVRWAINPDALRMYAPAMLNGHAAQVSDAELVVSLNGQNRASATLRLVYGREDRAEHALSIPAADAMLMRDEEWGLVHIEVAGVLSVTLKADGFAYGLVYASSPLLSAIGLPGGVYDVPELVPG